MDIYLTPANTAEQITQIKTLYMEAFPKAERKPFSLIIEKSRDGSADILSIESQTTESQTIKSQATESRTKFVGEAILAKDGDLVLLDYFAIAPGMRNCGAGSRALELLLQRYQKYRFFLEIESTVHAAPDSDRRLRRKDFYLRNGMACMDYLVSLWGVEMEILTNGCTVSYQEYYSLYEHLYGSRIKERIRLLENTHASHIPHHQ